MSKSASQTEHLKEMLVGNILTVTWEEVAKTAALYGVIGLFHFIFRHKFLIEQPDPPARRALREVEQFEQAGLARPRRAGEEIETAARQPEVKIAEHLRPRPVAQAHPVEFDDRRQAQIPFKRSSAPRSIAFTDTATPALPMAATCCYPKRTTKRERRTPR